MDMEIVKTLIIEGFTSPEIGEQLHFSGSHIRTTVKKLLPKEYVIKLRQNAKDKMKECKKFGSSWGSGYGLRR